MSGNARRGAMTTGYPQHAGPSLWHNLARAARDHGRKPALICFGRQLDYAEVHRQTLALAAWMRRVAGLRRGDRVLLYSQNCPQWAVAFYAVLRADAVVVPVNPMNRQAELQHVLSHAQPAMAFCAVELAERLQSARAANAAAGAADTLAQVVAIRYDDLLDETCGAQPSPGSSPDDMPGWAREPHAHAPGFHRWPEVLSQGRGMDPGPTEATRDDLAILPYTSGTTGLPKGCMHPHRTVMHNVQAAVGWSGYDTGTVSLSVLPLYHVAGMLAGMHTPFSQAATVVMLPRWNRELAAELIARHRVSYWSCITTMMIDFLDSPRFASYDLSSVRTIGGGGAPMPAAVAERLMQRTGLTYMEGYGLTETMGATHRNPRHRPKLQCLGIPFTGTDARIIDPDTGRELADEETGEIVAHGPQVFDGYWCDPGATAAAFVELDGKRFFRTGDLGRRDAEGYFFIVDRLKRMINASGFKVWPAEIEAMLHRHPAVLEPCVIAMRDSYRGESVKAVIVLRREAAGRVSEAELIAWCRERMASYKVPRAIAFAESLPKSLAGKVLWRELQALDEAEAADTHAGSRPQGT